MGLVQLTGQHLTFGDRSLLTLMTGLEVHTQSILLLTSLVCLHLQGAPQLLQLLASSVSEEEQGTIRRETGTLSLDRG